MKITLLAKYATCDEFKTEGIEEYYYTNGNTLVLQRNTYGQEFLAQYKRVDSILRSTRDVRREHADSILHDFWRFITDEFQTHEELIGQIPIPESDMP